MIYCNFIIVSYQLGFKYILVSTPVFFCKICPVFVYNITIEKGAAVSQSKFYYTRR
jgi:hypothetical protein